MKIKIYLMILTAMFCAILNAQSVFSFYGPAVISYQRDAYGDGMGGTGIGNTFRPNTSLSNPALSTTIEVTHFATALSMGYIHYKDSEKHSFRDDQLYLPYFNIVFPIKHHRVGINIHNVSSARLDTESKSSVTINEEAYDITEIQRVDFTLFKAGILYAHKNDFVNIGLGFNYLFGHNTRYSRQRFEDPAILSNSFEIDHAFKNPTIDFGLTKGFERFSTGLVFSLPVDLKGESYYRTNTLDQYMDDEVYQYPARMSLGVTVKAHEYVFVSSDIDIELWGNTANFDNSVDTFRMGLGVSWEGDRNSRNFVAKIPLRAGISYRNLPFELNDSKINEMAYHIGLSFPLKQYDSYLECAVKFFNRGDVSQHGYSEDGILFTIGTSGFDFFRRPTDRKAPRDIPVPDRRF